jgi:two-component system, OmpR family, phosphate regulon response regulator PhoB
MGEIATTNGDSLDHLTVVGEFLLDRETIRVWRGDKPLKLSMKQFRLMDAFMRRPGEPVSRKMLKDLAWGPESTVSESTVDAEIVRLRRAIGGRKRDMPVRTARKLGYVFEIPKRRAQSKRTLSTPDVEERA